MKKAILPTIGTVKALLDHTQGNCLGWNEDAKACIVEQAWMQTPTGAPIINSSLGVKTLLLDKQMGIAFLEKIGVVKEPAVSSIFALFNGQEFSDWIEVSYNNKLLNGNIGPSMGFISGVGFKVNDPVEEAVPGFKLIKMALTQLDYHGEVLLSLSETFSPTGITLGHSYGHFALFAEHSPFSVDQLLESCLVPGQVATLGNELILGNFVWLYPFSGVENLRLQAPPTAEKHLWRLLFGQIEDVLVTVHGVTLREARRRIRRTFENLHNSHPDICFRTDYGFGHSFLFSKDKYESALEKVKE